MGTTPVFPGRSLYAAHHRPFCQADIVSTHGQQFRNPPSGVCKDKDGIGIGDRVGILPEQVQFFFGEWDSCFVILRFGDFYVMGVIFVYDIVFCSVFEHLMKQVGNMLHVCVG